MLSYAYGSITLYAQAFQPHSASTTIYHSPSTRQNQPCGPTTPTTQRLPAITRDRFSLIRVRSPLLPESLLFSLPVGTEMFHFPTFPPHALYIQAPVTGLSSSWVSPFGHPRITARLPTPRGLSQAPTSFIGSRCQGIHHVLLVACRHKDARVHCVVLNIRASPPPRPPQRRTRRQSAPSHHHTCINHRRPMPQDPTVCQTHQPPTTTFHTQQLRQY